ncbi:MAG: hypothetical protein M1820_002931 [Bogoriella megaspora]|nr:MAG: hypothetical protein M1820_002931 [Bogoriella megaspora]
MDTSTEVSGQHGVKRPAEDDLEHEQRLAKRFNLLNIGQDGKANLYIPVPTDHPKQSPGYEEHMQMDDTKDKVYIYDLDAELAEDEPEEPRVVFIPDIEKHLTKIPKHLLASQEKEINKDNQLVLYGVPAALSIPEEKDSVRKAIIDARARAQKKQEEEQSYAWANSQQTAQESMGNFRQSNGFTHEVIDQDDGDLMDIG